MAQPKIGRKVWEEKMAEKARIEVAPPVPEPLPQERAAEILMGFLPEDTQIFIREAVGNMQLPLWQVLLGYVMRCADRQELFTPHILSAWEGGRRPSTVHACERCGFEFKSKFPDARYCCNRCFFQKGGHSEGCGIRAVPEVTTDVRG